MQVKHFEDFEIWREARRLTSEIYFLTSAPKFAKDFSLRGQIRSAATSIMSNIAEGFERAGNQEFTQFLYVAKGSCGEVRSQLYVAVDQGYISERESEKLLISFKRLSSMIGSLIKYLKESGMREPNTTVVQRLLPPKHMRTL
ncbi:MAG TPA: four helix bundle protein [Candidatus Binatia bacterium]|nr:four helix bundle protein [Candidatus Binatia bacterium]